jgi:hypothetical protein
MPEEKEMHRLRCHCVGLVDRIVKNKIDHSGAQ